MSGSTDPVLATSVYH